MDNGKPALLHIDSSPMGEGSVSRELTREFVERWRSAHPGGTVVSRDLAQTPVPVIDEQWILANLTPKESRTAEQEALLGFSTMLTRELLAADECVIGLPMHNWGPSSSFKLWVDQVVRFGETIVVTGEGPRGTLAATRVTVIVAAGRLYGPGSAEASNNFLVPWLRTFFANLGVTRLRVVLADGTVRLRYGQIGRAELLGPHLEVVRGLAAG
ncbi:FMN-dependent NADH-azoreductase [Paludibaculum fermentans]|uniref:FMN-dependent NADH-azoreductase n=1 Tax=Paludibaculum fermentans TaxID=1473598 RepID=UPI003EB7B493